MCTIKCTPEYSYDGINMYRLRRQKKMYVITLLDPILIIFALTIKLFIHLKIKL